MTCLHCTLRGSHLWGVLMYYMPIWNPTQCLLCSLRCLWTSIMSLMLMNSDCIRSSMCAWIWYTSLSSSSWLFNLWTECEERLGTSCMVRVPQHSHNNDHFTEQRGCIPRRPRFLKSHPLHRTCFSQYQASSAVLSWPRDGTAISCTQSSGVAGLMHMTGRRCLGRSVSLCAVLQTHTAETESGPENNLCVGPCKHIT